MKIGFIGAGNMVSAIAAGGFKTGFLTAENTFYTDKNGVNAPRLAKQMGGHYEADNCKLAANSDVIVLGVKPHAIVGVLTQLKPQLVQSKPLIISLAAGIQLATLEAAAGSEIPIIRMMPNVNAAVGASMTAVCPGTYVSVEHLDIATTFASTFGDYLQIPESQISIFTALAGSAPAWFYELIDSFAMAGVKHGLSKLQATQIVTQAMLGSALLVAHDLNNLERTPSNLIDQVCSPGGTTIAGLLSLRANGLSNAVTAAVDATVEKDQALGKKN